MSGRRAARAMRQRFHRCSCFFKKCTTCVRINSWMSPLKRSDSSILESLSATSEFRHCHQSLGACRERGGVICRQWGQRCDVCSVRQILAAFSRVLQNSSSALCHCHCARDVASLLALCCSAVGSSSTEDRTYNVTTCSFVGSLARSEGSHGNRALSTPRSTDCHRSLRWAAVPYQVAGLHCPFEVWQPSCDMCGQQRRLRAI